MGLFVLSDENQDISKGVLMSAQKEKIDYEKSFENWLENSPNILFDDESNTILWIGRQETANVGDSKKYSDLIGVDSFGNLIIVELKKGKAPRDVVAQILEYASWASSLNYEDLNHIYSKHCEKRNYEKTSLKDEFKSVFYPDDDEEPIFDFNEKQKMFIIAEEISSVVVQVAQYLREYKFDILCIKYTVHRTEQNEIVVSTERIVGNEDILTKRIIENGNRWNEDVKIKDVVYEAVESITDKEFSKIFSPVDVIKISKVKHPNINDNTVRCQLIQDCVNHNSRKHYLNGQRDYYYWVEKGKYRLYNPSTDGQWDKYGKKVYKK